ncbi:MAG: endonuclease V [Desulfurococcales archaeon ex4484_204]|nr:MAG: endonuclease V [Desulfurococcales archaeon ex4484_204]
MESALPNWFNASRARALQAYLSSLVRREGPISSIRVVAGLDLSYVGNVGIAVATALSYPDLALREYVVVVGEVSIPYVSGLLAFREAPLMFKAYEKLGVDADLIVVDGHGVTHPRGLGIASHIGVVLDVPTMGAAKKILVGRVVKAGGVEYLEVNDERGAVVFRRRSGKYVYLSIGHKVSISDVERIGATLFKANHILPEPTYIADSITKRERRRIASRVKR